MKFYIKNMVCSRCKMAVKAELEKAGLHPLSIELGEVEVDDEPDAATIQNLDNNLQHNLNLSSYLSQQLNYDYGHLSTLFSEVEGSTIEKYFIAQKIEKIKELIMYDELNLSQIANQLGYSSIAHLSAQFKKQTGLTPTFYRSLKKNIRRNIEEL
jgi:AraC-like DNA-binding protein